MGDYPMWLYFAFNSKLKFLDEFFGVYRLLLDSATGRNSFEKRERFIFSEYDVRMFFAQKYGLDICDKLGAIYCNNLGLNALSFCEFSKFTDYFIEFQRRYVGKSFFKEYESWWISNGIAYLKDIFKEQDWDKFKKLYLELVSVFEYTPLFVKFRYKFFHLWYYLVKFRCWNILLFCLKQYLKRA
jgi:hypothetical protein